MDRSDAGAHLIGSGPRSGQGRTRLQIVKAIPLRYVLSVPAGAEGAHLPILFFLHGYREAAPLEIGEAVTRHGPLHRNSSTLAREQFIVIAPQLPPPGGDVWSAHVTAIEAIVQEVSSRLQTDASRTFLTGFSFGGNGVFDLALLMPRFWTALWPVDPTRVPGGAVSEPVWLSFGELARAKKREFVELLQLQPISGSPTARVFTDAGEDHVTSARSAYASDDPYRWLLSRSGFGQQS